MICFDQWEQAEKLSEDCSPDLIIDREKIFYHGITAEVCFRCRGHSMEPTFFPGELVFIHQQNSFLNGQIVAVKVGSGMTLKRLFKIADGFLLVPDNKRFKPLKITGKDADTVKVYGIAVARR